MINIIVIYQNAAPISLEVEANTTVGTLKAMVQKQLSVAQKDYLADLYLRVGSHDMKPTYQPLCDDSSSLSTAGFEDGSVAYLLSRCLLDLGSAITDILAFLAPADQHKLRRTSSAMCEWFDSAAENGSLAFFVTFAPPTGRVADPPRWKHATSDPRGGTKHIKKVFNGGAPKTKFRKGTSNPTSTPRVIVTLHARNYRLSTFSEPTCTAPTEADNEISTDNVIIPFIEDFPFKYKLVITGLFGIRSVGNMFCKGIMATEIEFRDADQLRKIGSEWMSECSNLKSVTFSGFAELEEVENFWMHNCPSLDSVTFTGGMPKLKNVGHSWMSYCGYLKQADFSGLAALEVVGDKWISCCYSLESVTFGVGGMPKLKKVGDGWLGSNLKLKMVDFTGLTALEEVGSHWMDLCPCLERVKYPKEMPKLHTIGYCWMCSCPKLTSVNFAKFTALEQVGDRWMSQCPILKVVVGEMPKLRIVGKEWMADCQLLKSVTFTRFAALEEVGDRWMFQCPSLESVSFEGEMPKLRKVGNEWMSECTKLKSVTFSGFTELENVGTHWMYNCSSLGIVTFTGGMPKLQKIGSGWLHKCPKLKGVDFSGFAVLELVGDRSLPEHLKKLHPVKTVR